MEVERVLAKHVEEGEEPLPPSPAKVAAGTEADRNVEPRWPPAAGSGAKATGIRGVGEEEGGGEEEGEGEGEGDADDADTTIYLVKWRGLHYDGCTWEYARIAGAEAIEAFEKREATLAARVSASPEALHAHMHTCMHACTRAHVGACMHTYMHACMPTYVRACMPGR